MFAQWFSRYEMGQSSPSWVSSPADIAMLPPSDHIGYVVYYSFVKKYSDASYLATRAIVCPTNEVVDSTNID
jgi:hypothetical protein